MIALAVTAEEEIAAVATAWAVAACRPEVAPVKEEAHSAGARAVRAAAAHAPAVHEEHRAPEAVGGAAAGGAAAAAGGGNGYHETTGKSHEE